MKTSKIIVVVTLVGATLCGVTRILLLKQHEAVGLSSQPVTVAEAHSPQVQRDVQSAPKVAPDPFPSEPVVKPSVAETRSVSDTAFVLPDVIETAKKAPVANQKKASPGNPAPRPGKAPIQDPLARVVLPWVGMDAEAEAYWYAAINDRTLPAEERQDLIEDLNEDGISDPKHPTAGDLPLIVNRMLLIEAVGPRAMDQVNAEAFLEAYKDLVNLAAVATGGGEPVR